MAHIETTNHPTDDYSTSNSHFFFKNPYNYFLWPVLKLIQQIFKYLIYLRYKLYDLGLLKKISLPGKVISVGNIEVGGTGKTPIAIEIAHILVKNNYTVAILTRGYGVSLKKNQAFVLQNGNILFEKNIKAKKIPDEALLQSVKEPKAWVVVSPNRTMAAQWFIEKNKKHPCYWILDDGFQHVRIKRDLDIVLLDARKPLMEQELLPLGRLRDSFSSLKRADVLIWTYANHQQKLEYVPYRGCQILGLFSLETIKNIHGEDFFSYRKKAHIVCGIAKPYQFIEMLKEKGVDIGKEFIFPDHGLIPWKKILQEIPAEEAIITTEKDFFRQLTFFNHTHNSIFVAKLKISFCDLTGNNISSLPFEL